MTEYEFIDKAAEYIEREYGIRIGYEVWNISNKPTPVFTLKWPAGGASGYRTTLYEGITFEEQFYKFINRILDSDSIDMYKREKEQYDKRKAGKG